MREPFHLVQPEHSGELLGFLLAKLDCEGMLLVELQNGVQLHVAWDL